MVRITGRTVSSVESFCCAGLRVLTNDVVLRGGVTSPGATGDSFVDGDGFSELVSGIVAPPGGSGYVFVCTYPAAVWL